MNRLIMHYWCQCLFLLYCSSARWSSSSLCKFSFCVNSQWALCSCPEML